MGEEARGEILAACDGLNMVIWVALAHCKALGNRKGVVRCEPVVAKKEPIHRECSATGVELLLQERVHVLMVMKY